MPHPPKEVSPMADHAKRTTMPVMNYRMRPKHGSGMVREVVEDGPRVTGRLAWLAARLTIRPALAIGSHWANAPWPWGLVDFAAGAVTPVPGEVRATIRLPHCTARLVRAAGVLAADGSRSVV